MKKIYLFFILFVGFFSGIKANNIQISNLSTNYNTSTGVCVATFNLSWENSWRTSALSNWDAAWVFFKYKDGGNWRHLNLTGSNVTLPNGYSYSVPADNVGIYIYRTNNGSGNTSLTGCEVGVQPQMGSFDLKAFAIEMVYIPTAAFYVGDGASYGTYRRGDANQPLQIGVASGNNLYIGNNYYYELRDTFNTGNAALADGWPTGYGAFYCMKYETTNGQIRDFLNCLSYDQQVTHFEINPSLSSNVNKMVLHPVNIGDYWETIRMISAGNSTSKTPAVVGCNKDTVSGYDGGDDGENIPFYLNGYNHSVLLSYLDWCGLRPMTEMEYEKVCRGPNTPVAREYAYGTNTFDTAVFNVTNWGTDSQSVSNTPNGGRINVNTTNYNGNYQGPFRSGTFATSSSSRLTSGGSYYGVMEMSGNLQEVVVVSSNNAGRSYRGVNGDGVITQVGHADEDYWPGQNGNGNVASANNTYNGGNGASGQAGLLIRGGEYALNADRARVSDRLSLIYAGLIGGGIRGVRTE